MSVAYFDRVLSVADAKRVLSQAGATHSPGRSKPFIAVYKLEGEGEAMVEKSGDKLRVRLFKGKCAC
jgi:hypothetical protein